MEYLYEFIKYEEGVPVSTFIRNLSINTSLYHRMKKEDLLHMPMKDLHWHKDIEILLILKGSVKVTIEQSEYLLGKNDLILVNCNEVHTTSEVGEEDAIIAGLFINSEYCSSYFPNLHKMVFECNSFLHNKETQNKFDVIRYYIARIVWEANKKANGYQFIIQGCLNLLIFYIVNNFQYEVIDDKNIRNQQSHLKRLKRITEYVNDNYNRKISLKELAEKENLNLYYLSHYINDKLGISFQKYLNNIRLEVAIDLLIYTEKKIVDIVFECGFADVNYFYKIFKKKFNYTPLHYRERYSIYHDNNKKSSTTKQYYNLVGEEAFEKLSCILERKNLHFSQGLLLEIGDYKRKG